jgi:hypothetical protein
MHRIIPLLLLASCHPIPASTDTTPIKLGEFLAIVSVVVIFRLILDNEMKRP